MEMHYIVFVRTFNLMLSTKKREGKGRGSKMEREAKRRNRGVRRSVEGTAKRMKT